MIKKNPFLYFAVLIILLSSNILFGSSAKVAIVVEPELMNFAGQLSLQSHKVKSMIEPYGINTVEITADQMADPEFFNTENFSVIVMTYGNAFPLVGYKNLRKFHKNGGCLVVNGIPFTHPAERTKHGWEDQGHINYLHHDEKGIGTGNFKDPPPGTTEVRIKRNNVLKFPPKFLPRKDERLQYLNIETLDSSDKIYPIVEVKTKNNNYAPATAIIEHNCDLFKGAVDIWMGPTAKQLELTDNFFLKQVIVRGIAYCLNKKGDITEDNYKTLLDKMNSEKMPDPLPSGFKGKETPRPWGDTFLPKSKTPAKHLLVVKMDRISEDERIALACLQGLTSRDKPRIWLNYSDRNDQFWLDWHKEKGYIRSYEYISDYKTLFKKFSSSFEGAVIPDDKLYRGKLIAANVAACEDLIICSKKLASKLKIPILKDLRGKFDTYAEGMQWVWYNYKNRLNHHLCDIIHPSWLQSGAFAYDIQWKGIIFWIAAPKDSVLPGADSLAEMKVMAEIFREMPPNTAMLGFPSGGEGVGLGEVGGTSFCGGYGKSLVCTDRLANISITSGVKIDSLDQKPQAPAPKLEKDKIYIAVVYSDGDNENVWRLFFKNFFDSPLYGKFPLSFGIGPAMIDLQPAVMQWYYENASHNTEFISDVSGIGYMRPDDYASKFFNKKDIIEGFVEWTAKYMEKTDISTVRTVGGDDEAIAPYLKGIPEMHSMFADMGRYSGMSGYDELVYTKYGMPVFRCVNGWSHGPKGVIKEIKEQIGNHRPAFANCLAHAWTLGSMKDLKKYLIDKLNDDMVLVTPEQLAELYKEAKKKGWAN